MTGKSYSTKAQNQPSCSEDEGNKWAQAADDAAKRAEEEVEKIKTEVKEQLKNDGKT